VGSRFVLAHEGLAVPEEETYRTVASHGESRFEVRGSTFLGQVQPAASVAAAESVIEAVEREYEDATHNVPAYRVRADPLREYASDADEPAGSAGKPALNVLAQRDLENVVAVVTRYYGGTNLGVGGLARAYGRAVKEAVDDASVASRRPHTSLTVEVAYDDSGKVRSILESADVRFDGTYDSRVTFEVDLPTAEVSPLRERIASATSGRARIAEDTSPD
jgi:uncharacterized YigZ family protein